MNYYTVLSDDNGLIVGTVFNSQNNQEVYKTKPYTTTSHVTRDVNNFLAITTKKDSTEQVATNTIKSTATVPSRTGQQRCCGR